MDYTVHTGGTFHGTEEILDDLNRIAAKTAKAADNAYFEKIKSYVRYHAEVQIRPSVPIPPGPAIKGATAMALTRGMQGVQVIGFEMTAVDLGHAAEKSARRHSAKPIVAETIRQGGSWAAARAGVPLAVPRSASKQVPARFSLVPSVASSVALPATTVSTGLSTTSIPTRRKR